MSDTQPATQDIASTVRSRPAEELIETVKAELTLPDPPSHVVAQLLAEDTQKTPESNGGPA